MSTEEKLIAKRIRLQKLRKKNPDKVKAHLRLQRESGYFKTYSKKPLLDTSSFHLCLVDEECKIA